MPKQKQLEFPDSGYSSGTSTPLGSLTSHPPISTYDTARYKENQTKTFIITFPNDGRLENGLIELDDNIKNAAWQTKNDKRYVWTTYYHFLECGAHVTQLPHREDKQFLDWVRETMRIPFYEAFGCSVNCKDEYRFPMTRLKNLQYGMPLSSTFNNVSN
jgi:hypothetical protein